MFFEMFIEKVIKGSSGLLFLGLILMVLALFLIKGNAGLLTGFFSGAVVLVTCLVCLTVAFFQKKATKENVSELTLPTLLYWILLFILSSGHFYLFRITAYGIFPVSIWLGVMFRKAS